MAKTVMQSRFKLKYGDLVVVGLGKITGLKKTRDSKEIRDNADNFATRVLAGNSKHEKIVVTATLFGESTSNAKDWETKFTDNASNDDTDNKAREILSISFFDKEDGTGDLGQYKATGCKVISVGVSDLDRENEADAATIEIEIQPADGGWV